MTNGRTGIEIQVALAPGQRTIGRLLTALHLETLAEGMGSAMQAVIAVDGVERAEPLYEAHFVEAAPGEHDVEMFIRGEGPSGDALQRAFRGQSQRVTVQPGRVAVLLYKPTDGLSASLDEQDDRAA